MPLYSITAIVEAEDMDDARGVHEAVRRAICPHADDAAHHECPRAWTTILSELDDDEAAEWEKSGVVNR